MSDQSDPWNFADVFEAVAAGAPDRVVVIHGNKQLTWRSFDRRANALAADLLRAGVGRQGKIMTYLYNSCEFLETYYGAIKAAMVAKKVNLVLNPQATISYQPSVDITDAVVAELNRTVPLVGITPPAGWQPGGQGAAPAPAAPVAPKPTTPTPTPPGR